MQFQFKAVSKNECEPKKEYGLPRIPSRRTVALWLNIGGNQGPADGPLPELLRREPRQFNSPPAGHQMDCSGAEFKIGCHAQYSHETGIAPNLILFVFAIAIIQYLIIQAQSQIRKDGDACDAGERSFVGYLHAWYGPFHGERARRIEGEVAMCGKNRINASSCGTSRKASPVTRT